jgi:hypothetical protein
MPSTTIRAQYPTISNAFDLPWFSPDTTFNYFSINIFIIRQYFPKLDSGQSQAALGIPRDPFPKHGLTLEQLTTQVLTQATTIFFSSTCNIFLPATLVHYQGTKMLRKHLAYPLQYENCCPSAYLCCHVVIGSETGGQNRDIQLKIFLIKSQTTTNGLAIFR